MPNVPVRIDRVRERAMELGIYLPLGAYTKVKDELSDLSSVRIQRVFSDLIDRGQERMQPVERIVRRRARKVEAEVEKTATAARKQVRKTVKRADAAADAVAPKMPRVAAPKSASDLAIEGYDELTAADITAQLAGLTQTELAKIYKYERANENRSTVLEATEAKFISLPIPTYDALTADEIMQRVERLSADDLNVIRRYEEDTKARKTVLEKLETAS
ncbi:MAG: hypothetical protein M3345_00940 [Actinomycetota bacterium]|nr:hypothetical protein [Actinomycetota bacterium]